jgi:hypothetical protein
MSDFGELGIEGRVATPADPDWDEVRQAWNLAADPHPSAVAVVENAADIAAVIGFARAHELRVLGQGTGHGALAVGSFDDTIVIRTDRMRRIEVDAEARTARVEAGALAMELGAAAQKEGLCSMPGSSPDVGLAGYTLGGGLGWLGRRHGFACNRVSAIELVSADGESRRVDAENEPDLFWALRGGGGGYAIVTALHLSLLPVADLYAGVLIFPAELGTDAVGAYRDWARTVPDEVTSIVRFLHPPPSPDVPEPIRDKALLTIDAACIGSQDEGERLIAPLRELGDPIIDTFGQIPAEGLSRIHMDPEQPVPALSNHAVIRELPDQAIEAFYGAVGPQSGSPLVVAELRQLGGALGRSADGAGALDKLEGEFAMFCVGAAMTPELGEAVGAHLDLLATTMDPWASGGGYFNFAERPCEVEALLPASTCERLAEVKRRWDPDRVIRANHELAAASA